MAQASWWEQVGPRKFYLDVARALKTTSVVVWFPAYATENILIPIDEYWPAIAESIYYLDASEAGTPEALLQNEVPSATELDNLFSLLGQTRSLFVVKNVQKATWPAWCRLVDGYHRHVSAAKLSAVSASRFLVLAKAIELEFARSSVVTIRHFRYQGTVSLADMESYCNRLMVGNGRPSIERQVAASIIAHLALWDKGSRIGCVKGTSRISSHRPRCFKVWPPPENGKMILTVVGRPEPKMRSTARNTRALLCWHLRKKQMQ